MSWYDPCALKYMVREHSQEWAWMHTDQQPWKANPGLGVGKAVILNQLVYLGTAI